ncbi:hypothetical protein [Nocardia shimofusensis]|uniref:hypothetical protein n=1 Tax=Nocardia shimofusensis TaxID=228596 RepID=UPI00082F5F98|nr:hypothetical protein [Nocardia shimofusensis]
MTVERPMEDEVTQLALRVEKARGRLAYQFDPALTEALSESELQAERELAERIREQDREQRWKEVQAAAVASDQARQTAEVIAKADMRDLLLARKAIAAQRRESSPHAKLASLYRHRSWSLRALAGVVAAGMLWSAVNVQQNIAPGGPSDPLFWFSYLLEGMISVCLIIIMIGTNKVAEWGVVDNRRQVATAEMALLSLTVLLNTYPYMRAGQWYEVGVHAIAPVMIGVALLIHDAASARYGLAIYRATEQVRELPDPAEQIRNSLPSLVAVRARGPIDMVPRTAAEYEIAEQIDLAVEGPVDPETGEPLTLDESLEVPAEGELAEVVHPEQDEESPAPAVEKRPAAEAVPAADPARNGIAMKEASANGRPTRVNGQAVSADGQVASAVTKPAAAKPAATKPAATKSAAAAEPAATASAVAKPAAGSAASKSAAQSSAPAPAKAAPVAKPAAVTASPAKVPAASAQPTQPVKKPATQPVSATAGKPAATKPATVQSTAVQPVAQSVAARPAAPVTKPVRSAGFNDAPASARPVTARQDIAPARASVPQVPAPKPETAVSDSRAMAKDSRTMSSRSKKKERPAPPPDPDGAYHEVVRSSGIYDTGQFRIAEALEQELAEMAEARRRARSSRQRLS